jgi:septal ring factor EnvC (AmiA/AmiB activator)
MTAPTVSPLEDVVRALERSAVKREGSLGRAMGRDCSLAVEAELRWQIGELRRHAQAVRDADRRLADLRDQVNRLEKQVATLNRLRAQDERERREATRSAATEASWQEKQGADYGTY